VGLDYSLEWVTVCPSFSVLALTDSRWRGSPRRWCSDQAGSRVTLTSRSQTSAKIAQAS
jgi:hypothetical protein